MAAFTVIDDYKVFCQDDDILGGGTCGQVWRGQNMKSELYVAVKKVLLGDDEEYYTKYVEGEVRALQAVSHPHIIKLFHSAKSGKFFCLFMELCEEGDLDSYLKKHGELSEDTMLSFMQGAAEAVNCLHHLQQPIAHRDIKPDNLLIKIENSLPVIKLTDFGFARTITSEKNRVAGTYVGTPNYMAPEVRPDKDNYIKYHLNVDIFSLGVVLLAMITHTKGEKLTAVKGKYFKIYVKRAHFVL